MTTARNQPAARGGAAPTARAAGDAPMHAGCPAGGLRGGAPFVWLLRAPQAGESFQGYGRATPQDHARTLDLLADLARLMYTVGGKLTGASTFNPDIPAGYTYLGQFIAHDMMDTRPIGPIGPQAGRNYRAPLRLEALYGGGPDVSPWLYDPGAAVDEPRRRLRLGWTRDDPDMPQGPAPGPDDIARFPAGGPPPAGQPGAQPFDPLVGDRRSDENLILSQLAVTFHKFHNRIVDLLDNADPVAGRDGFQQWERLRQHFRIARHLTIRAYHAVVLEDYLQRLVAPATFATHAGRVRQAPAAAGAAPAPGIPIEFALAAFRFGHAMVADHYRFSDLHFEADATLDRLIDFAGLDGNSTGLPLHSHWVIDWRRFFFAPGGPHAARGNLSRLIRPMIAGTLGTHASLRASDGRHGGVDYRTMARGFERGLWNGPALASALGIADQLCDGEIADLLRRYRHEADGRATLNDDAIARLAADAPLFFYILAEAELRGHGRKLGPLGGEIVARVLVDHLIAARETPCAADQALLTRLGTVDRQAAVTTMPGFVAFSGHGIR